jgi:hypothetical protein
VIRGGVIVYRLKRKDSDVCLIDFKHDELESTVGLEVKQLFNASLMPLDIKNDHDLFRFIIGRFIPDGRVNADKVRRLARGARLEDMIETTKSLSLMDDFWIVGANENLFWNDCNLFKNRFSKLVEETAFTGSSDEVNMLSFSPEFTTNGMLLKAWRRLDGKIYLHKAGTFGFANTGNEPYSEFYASQVATRLGLNHVDYTLSMWKGILCSVCELFTSERLSFIPASRLYKDTYLVTELFKMDRRSELYNSIMDMVVFDDIIGNTDRHLNNFGVLQDNDTLILDNKIGPIFDNGVSLLCYAMNYDIKSMDYVNNHFMLADRVDFDAFKKMLTRRQIALVRKMINFKFKKHSRYNWPDWRIKAVEEFIQKRVRLLLG